MQPRSLRPLDRVADAAAIHAVITDPWIAAKVRHDHREPSYIDHPDVEYLGCYDGDELAGVFMLIHDFIEVTIHAYIRRRWTAHGRAWGRLALDHAFASQHVQRVAAPILEGLESAVNYCLKLGFKREGFARCAAVKNGRLIGVHLLAITREDRHVIR